MFFFRIPAPNEAFVITGSRKGTDGASFKVVTGKGTFVWPWKQRSRSLSLDLRQAELQEECVTNQGIPLTVRAVAVFKVGNTPEQISNAATRFMDQQGDVESITGRVLAGHLRSIIGGLTVEEIISNRNRVSQEVITAATAEMEKMGLDLDSMQIQEITDNTGYIQNIAAPHTAAIERDARIAQAAADQAATEKEQDANAQKAGFSRDSEVQQQQAAADIAAAQAKAAQAGPLANAQAAQEVAEEQAKLAQKQAEVTEANLLSQVQKPADAEAYRVRTLAEARRYEIEQQSDALKDDNLERIIATRTLDILPQIAESVGGAIANANLTVLNGAEGLEQVFTGALAMVGTVYKAVTQAATPTTQADGQAHAQAGLPQGEHTPH